MVPRLKLSVQLTVSMDLLLETEHNLLEKGSQQVDEFHFLSCIVFVRPELMRRCLFSPAGGQTSEKVICLFMPSQTGHFYAQSNRTFYIRAKHILSAHNKYKHAKTSTHQLFLNIGKTKTQNSIKKMRCFYNLPKILVSFRKFNVLSNDVPWNKICHDWAIKYCSLVPIT